VRIAFLKVVCGENEDSSRARAELRSGESRRSLDKRESRPWGFEDPNENFVQLVNSVISHHIPRACSPSCGAVSRMIHDVDQGRKAAAKHGSIGLMN
jgi:hypothetical protein